MNLDTFYSLRTNFAVIGLTGRVGSGCSEIAKKLGNADFMSTIRLTADENLTYPEKLKNNICYTFLNTGNNWQNFQIINYKDILLLHLIHECNKNFEDFNKSLDTALQIICQNGKSKIGKEHWKNRIDVIDDHKLIKKLKKYFIENERIFQSEREFSCTDLNKCLRKPEALIKLYNFFFESFTLFSDDFYKIINKYSVTKRTRLTHDLANNLRSFGNVKELEQSSFENIYTIAETINIIIKAWKKEKKSAKIVIDSLKNSLELMYFKEKYSAFYMITTNKSEEEREEYIFKRIVENPELKSVKTEIKKEYVKEMLWLDKEEYKTNDYKKGNFSVPDIENCIQKSDYHLFIDKTDSSDRYLSIDYQLLRLVALISQPGIITPTAIERTMQVAYNAKLNSGCISRQVGAVITDEKFSIKAIGWNDVPQGQIPCNLRNVKNLTEGETPDKFSDYEKTKPFVDFVKSNLPDQYANNLSGKNCSFCFKSFQNAKEDEKNQVHTRSLHAEENAMLQIAKNGGQGLKGGNLFTTASPCELCSKKAYQLGIKKIFYIDPYPGIATTHILKAGYSEDSGPNLIMFQGAVGRVYHKLYEPFMAYKDEIAILTGISPIPSIDLKIKNLIKNEDLQKKIIEELKGKTELQKEEFLEKSFAKSLEKIPLL